MNYIVTTTIFKPSLALKKFSNLKDWTLIVVGDLKTPHRLYQNNNKIIYLHPKEQEKMDKKLSDLIGWNCIQRRNFGYILANKLNAEYIATVDDDNIPLRDWGNEILLKKNILVNYYKTKEIAFDPLSIFKNKKKIWHRGFPIELIFLKEKIKKKKIKIKADIQANLWNDNPDIDAVNRISFRNNELNFKFNDVKAYTSNKLSPFNSQNTILTRKIIKDYFLFPFIGRMDDIWASYYVQSLGAKVIYAKSTVKQIRNPHNLLLDFQKEVIGYANNLKLLNALKISPNYIKKFLPKRSYAAFKQYKKNFL